MLLHRFEQRCLSLRRRPVDFVRQQHVGEDRSLHEHHPPLPGLVLLQNLRPGDVGWHQVGRELNALKIEMEHLRNRLHEQRLRQSGRSRDETMPTREERDQQLLDRFVLAHDRLGQLRPNPLPPGADHFQCSQFGFIVSVEWVHSHGRLRLSIQVV